MGSFHHFQHLKAGLPRDRRPTASNLLIPAAGREGNKPTALGPSKKQSGILLGYYWIEILDMTRPLPKELLNPFYMPVLDPDSTEIDSEGTVLRRCIY